MSGSGKKEKKSSSSSLESEVDQLLKAAEDHVLLNLKLNSHTKSSSTATHNLLSSSSSSSLDPDLTRRFESLKSTPTKSESVDVDHLSARFDALKSSLGHQGVLDSSSNVQESDGGDDDEDDDGVSQKEVEKLMRWAMDAARLESASKTKDEIDDDDEDKEDDDDDEEEEDSEEESEKKESNGEGKGKPKKWYFF